MIREIDLCFACHPCGAGCQLIMNPVLKAQKTYKAALDPQLKQEERMGNVARSIHHQVRCYLSLSLLDFFSSCEKTIARDLNPSSRSSDSHFPDIDTDITSPTRMDSEAPSKRRLACARPDVSLLDGSH